MQLSIASTLIMSTLLPMAMPEQHTTGAIHMFEDAKAPSMGCFMIVQVLSNFIP